MNLGPKIKTYREAKGWNQKELAEKADVSPSTISALENDRFTPSPELIQRIAHAMGLPLQELSERATELTLEAKFNLVRLHLHRHHDTQALDELTRIQEREALLDEQQDEWMLLQATALLSQPDRLPAIEKLYALVYKLERAPQLNHVFVARVQSTLGDGWALNGDFVTAVHHYKRGLEVLNRLTTPDSLLLAHLHFRLAVCSQVLRHDDEAMDSIRESVDLYNSCATPESMAEMFAQLADSYLQGGDPVQAAAAYQKAVASYNLAGHVRGAVRAQGFEAFHKEGRLPEEVLPFLQRELDALRHPLEQALLHTRIAKIHLDLQDLPNAKQALEKAEVLSADAPASGERAYTLLIKAMYLLEAGEYESACDCAFAASDIYVTLPYYHTNLKESLRIGKEAVLRLRKGDGGLS
ncbi:helix-turn-helix transcriptional regulator [Tumebacillus sp. ITR2]|uniref:Helix-turn-helix transcriptional regulator n=1 Tax=Tumebacillus amylolyticus TaxID=2801339 RepID=A0ABS1JG20_9BACL|nr:helix-turn-helix transcriptional regulator [Tumebacillus amylolyticus]MBL0389175.1 helix-turn-helix transcriptional regulator [Tumebacillus amylolyticus]